MVSQRLAQTPHKDVYVYIHGFANTFDDAVFRAAELWHFMGRQGVCIAYTWPSGYGGPFGYFHDRESGEYTVLHLKQFLARWPIVRMSSGFTSSRTAAVPTWPRRRCAS